MREIQTAAASLSEVAVVEETIDLYEEETRKLRKRLNNKINDLKEEIRSMTSRKSIVSRKSKMSSRRSHASSRSSTALKAEAAAKTAELEVQVRYHSEEVALSKFKLKKEFEMSKARLQAIAETENTEGSTDFQLPEADEEATKRVERFLQALPNQTQEEERIQFPSAPVQSPVKKETVGPRDVSSTSGSQAQVTFAGFGMMPPTSSTVTPSVTTTSALMSNTLGVSATHQTCTMPWFSIPASAQVSNVPLLPIFAPIVSTRVATSSFPQSNWDLGLNSEQLSLFRPVLHSNRKQLLTTFLVPITTQPWYALCHTPRILP